MNSKASRLRQQHADGEFFVCCRVANLRFAIFAGAEAALGTKCTGKVWGIAKPGGERNLGDRVTRGAQEGKGAVEPQLKIDL